MSLFTQIDSLYNQTDQLIARAQSYTPPQPPPPSNEGPPPGKNPVAVDNSQDTSTSKSGTDSGGSGTTKTTNSGSGTTTTTGSGSGSGGSPTGGNGENDLPAKTTGSVSAIGQNVVKTWNEDIKPALAQVDPKVWYGIGGGIGLIILVRTIKN